jgi:hypothetical protein
LFHCCLEFFELGVEVKDFEGFIFEIQKIDFSNPLNPKNLINPNSKLKINELRLSKDAK